MFRERLELDENNMDISMWSCQHSPYLKNEPVVSVVCSYAFFVPILKPNIAQANAEMMYVKRQ